MFEQLAIEQTPVAAHIYTQNYADRPKTPSPIQERRAPVQKATLPNVMEIPALAKTAATTATLADMSERRQSKTQEDRLVFRVDPATVIDKTRNDRVTLLARKYAGKIDNEGTARLEILTERLNRLAPLVEEETLDRVAQVVEVARRPNAKLEALKAKYRI